MILHILGLAITWVALWGDITAANILWGVFIACALIWFAPIKNSDVTVRLVPTLRLTVYMMKNLVTSSVDVLRTVLHPTELRVSDSVVSVPLRTRSHTVAVVVANSTSLTPGTMSLALDRQTFVLRVHVLGSVDEQAFKESMWHLEELVMRALGLEVHR